MAGFQIPFGIDVTTAIPADQKYGPYASTSAAIAAIPQVLRYDGLTVQITGLGNYWWLASDLTNTGLIPKQQSAITTKSKTQLDTLISGSSLEVGGLYKITGVHPTLYNDGSNSGTTIYLRALTTNKLERTGIGLFYNPKYNKAVSGYGIWSSVGTYSINDTVIWGGYIWKNLTGSTGTSTNVLSLDNTNWVKVVYNTTDYDIVLDNIDYDITNNMIVRRYSSISSNDVIFTKEDSVFMLNYYSYSYNAIAVFQWGNEYDGSKGVGEQKIYNSINENINFTGLYQTNLVFTNQSLQKNLFFAPTIQQTNVRLSKRLSLGNYNLTDDKESALFCNIVFDTDGTYKQSYTTDFFDGTLHAGLINSPISLGVIPEYFYLKSLSIDSDSLVGDSISIGLDENYTCFIPTITIDDINNTIVHLNNSTFKSSAQQRIIITPLLANLSGGQLTVSIEGKLGLPSSTILLLDALGNQIVDSFGNYIQLV